MQNTPRKQAKIVDAYIDAAESIKAMLFELSQYADGLYAEAPEDATLADVRKLASIKAKLKKIHNQAIGY